MPLRTGLTGAGDEFCRGLPPGELETLARLIMRESDRIDELIQRFGRPELDHQAVDCYPLLDEALALLAARGVTVEAVK